MVDKEMLRLRIRGTAVPIEDTPAVILEGDDKPDIKVRKVRRYRIDSGRSISGQEVISVAPDEVVEVALADGVRFWTSAERLTKDVFRDATKRDAEGIIDMPYALEPADASRGFFGKLFIKTLTFFGLDLPEFAARKIGKRWESKTLNLDSDKKSELFRCVLLPKDGKFRLDAIGESISTDRPHLLFLHGTASSTGGSFGKLWTSEALELRKQLRRIYGMRTLAFEHRSLTKSPIDNAIRLAKKLPAGAKLHIVSHSRGGLVGELLARASVGPEKAPFSAEELQLWKELDSDEERGDLDHLNRLLAEKRFDVEKFVRVACPSRGTSLASGRLDIYLSVIFNLLGQVPFLKLPGVNIAFDIFEELIQAIAKERLDPGVLPGLEAMVPKSPLISLINHPNTTVNGTLRVIAGDIEGDNLGSAIAALLTDPLYQRNHDLVVDTEAMFGGAVRSGGAAYAFRQGADVSHFNYFANQQSANHLVQALAEDQDVPDGFEAYEAEPTDKTIVVATRSDRPRPTIILIPGLMGSHLTAGNQRVWLDLGNLALGGVERLKINAAGVRAEALVQRYYAHLITFLGRTYDVIPFPYDWRRSIADAADDLAEAIKRRMVEAGADGTPISIVAHSMGGLVARLMIARHPDLWKRMDDASGTSRLIMLGTPNHGSYALPFMLTGRDSLIKKLALLDLKNGRKVLLKTIADYPGVLELLPNHGSSDLFSKATWDKFLEVDGGEDAGWRAPFKGDLENARKIRGELDAYPNDPERFCSVAGWAKATPSDVAVEPDDDGRPRLVFKATRQGDGRVPWSASGLDNVKTWYMPVAHGDLARHEQSFPAILDLLQKGTTTVLSETPPEARDVAEHFEFVEERSPLFPTYNDLASSALGGAGDDRRDKIATRIRVDVIHGNLAFASHPVMVGHYEHDSIVSAEAHLDRGLSGHLTHRHRLGRYPGKLNQSAIVLNACGSLKGAIVIGLGQIGDLSPSELTQSVSSGVRDYAMAIAERRLCKEDVEAAPLFTQITTLLIGTGAGGVQIADSVSAILRGIANANDALATLDDDNKVTIDCVEIVELYEDRAIQAAQSLRRLSDDPELKDRIVSDNSFRIKPRRGGRTRAAFFEGGGWWQRLQITQSKQGRLNFKLLTNRARAELHTRSTQRRLVDSFIDKVIGSTYEDPEIGITLYEMLVPYELKQYAPEQRDLVLVLDPDAASYPWELMRPRAIGREVRAGMGQKPTAIETGLVRQLQQIQFRQNVVNASTNLALVIGDPKSTLVELPGAQAEAKAVASCLEAAGYDAPSLIGEDASAEAIMRALHAREYRILHLAGHGIYEKRPDDDEKESPWFQDIEGDIAAGMVIGDHLLLTPAEVQQMRTVPEVVFINCCHLGQMREDDEPVPNNPPRLAANLATEFIRMGVRAVVAAGWAIDDRIAEVFANAFYEGLLRGEPFGRVVQRARQAAFEAGPRSNSWGAYQCYGDPAFTLTIGGDAASEPGAAESFVSARELIVELGNKAKDATTATPSKLERLTKEVLDLENELPEEWRNDPDVHVALGEAFGELGNFERAVGHYQAALRGEQASASLRVLEQFANFQTRLAASLPADKDREAEKMMDEADERLVRLIGLAGATRERHSLRGSIAKRRMRFAKNDADRATYLDVIAARYKEAAAILGDDGDKPTDPYPFFNETAAQILKYVITGKADRSVKNLRRDLESAKEASSQRDKIDPNYWDVGIIAESLLLQKLIDREITPEHEQEIVAALLDARRRDGSPRELRSVREQIDFICLTIDERSSDPKRRDLAAVIGRIRSSLKG